MGIANLLTLMRLLLIPVFVLVFYLPFRGAHVASALIFGVAALTDWLDGHLARTLSQTSRFGAFLDPVADKLMVVTALVLLVGERTLPFLALPAVIIVCREILVSALREWMAEVGKRAKVSVSRIAKLKTAAQMLAVMLLLLYRPKGGAAGFALAGYLLLYMAALLTLWSMVVYLRAAWRALY